MTATPNTSADPPRGPLRRDAARNRDRLLAAAGEVFDAHGLEASVADVAAAAGVGMGTLYRRFPTKGALIDALARDVLERIIELAEEGLQQPTGAGLEHFLYASSAYLAAHRGCLPRLWSTDHELVGVARDLIARLLADAKAHGRVRDELTNTDITVIMWSIRGIVEAAGDLAHDIWQRQLEILVAGMRPDGPELINPAIDQRQIDRILTAGGSR